MLCGVSSCAYVQDDNDDVYCRRPRLLSPSSSKSKRRDKNPYSNRGLDKFATVVADLEAKKEKIMQKVAFGETNPDDVVLVRFTHSPSHGGWVPIVIGKKKPPQKKTEEDHPKQALPAAFSSADIMNGNKKMDGQRRRRRTWNSYYWPVVLILILVCLVMFGRSFAILCTSIWWYLVPMMSGDGRRSGLLRKEHGIGRMDENSIKNMGGDLKAHHQLKAGSPPRHHLHLHHMQGRK
ncbi:hypothetical protein ACLOJK_003527 [Asimina triloba]